MISTRRVRFVSRPANHVVAGRRVSLPGVSGTHPANLFPILASDTDWTADSTVILTHQTVRAA